MQLQHPDNANQNSEIFTISTQVPAARTPQLSIGRTSGDKSSSVSQQHVLVDETDCEERRTRRENDTGTTQLVFGKERPRVFQLLRHRTVELYLSMKHKSNSRTLNLDSSFGQDAATDEEPQLQTLTTTYSAVDSDFTSTRLNVPRSHTRRTDSTQSDHRDPVQNLVVAKYPRRFSELKLKYLQNESRKTTMSDDCDPVQNMAQESIPSAELEDEMKTGTGRVDGVPVQRNTTTAIIHQEQSPWLKVKDSDTDNADNAKNMLRRALSMNMNTGKPVKMGSQVSDDSNVKYNWREVIEETGVETKPNGVRNVEDVDRLATSSSGTVQGQQRSSSSPPPSLSSS